MIKQIEPSSSAHGDKESEVELCSKMPHLYGTTINRPFYYLVEELRTAVNAMNMSIGHAKEDQAVAPDHELRKMWGTHNALIAPLAQHAVFLAEMVDNHIRELLALNEKK